jgi:hypothetical protein
MSFDRTQPPSADQGGPFIQPRTGGPRAPQGKDGSDPGDEEWLSLAQQAYTFSTSYVDNNYRRKWDNAIRAFNSQHATDSKYNSTAFDKRSKIFRPKTRAIIRKNEAAAATAFFSNMEVVEIEAEQQGDPRKRASADVMKELLSYRLNKSIPWFQVVMGAAQDAQTVGVVCGHVYWDYEATNEEIDSEEASDQTSEYQFDRGSGPSGKRSGTGAQTYHRPKKDVPCVDLIPIENIRIDPAASWVDPIGTSPYLIHLIPMYVQEVKDRMKSGKWRAHPDSVIASGLSDQNDTTRQAREDKREDPMENTSRSINDYQIVWVQRHIHKRRGQDWEFYTLGTEAMLTDAKPLKEVVFHGRRPYVMGCAVIETHTTMPSGVAELGMQLQAESNELANAGLDSTKFVLNKRYLVKRGRDVDMQSLVRNVPGGITQVNDVEKDVKEISWPDITQSVFAEQDRVNADFDELLGNFSQSSVLQNKQAMESPMRTLGLLNTGASMMTEYLIRTLTETFVLPVLRQLMLLEQYYETDETIIAIAGQKAKVFERFGIDQVTDDMLNAELSLRCNVTMGAADPTTKLQKFVMGTMAFANLVKQQVPGLDYGEVGKEIFGHLGYQDGARFFGGQDPEKALLNAKLQQSAQMIQQLSKQVSDLEGVNKAKIMTAQIGAQSTQQKADKDNATKIILEKMKQGQDAFSKNVDMQITRVKELSKLISDRETQRQKQEEDTARQHEEGKKKSETDSHNKALLDVMHKFGEHHTKLTKEIAGLAKQLGKPRKIVRGKDGRAEGLEIMQ